MRRSSIKALYCAWYFYLTLSRTRTEKHTGIVVHHEREEYKLNE